LIPALEFEICEEEHDEQILQGDLPYLKAKI
jgi:hypothetical protein